MKKLFGFMLLCVTSVFILSSCSKDEDYELIIKDTTYRFSYSAIDAPEGFDLDITLFEYNEKDEIIDQKNINNVYTGYSTIFKANKNAEKVKVYITASNGDISIYNWVQQIFYLEKENNIDINPLAELN